MKKLILALCILIICIKCQAIIQLPVEVIGEDGYITSITFNYPSGISPSVATSLYMRIHNLSYDGKMDVKINGGPWTSIGNTTQGVSITGIDKQVGGIGSGFDTIRLNFAISTGLIRAGPNTIFYRMNHTDGISIGYRIIDLNLQTSIGTNILPGSEFVNVDVNSPAFKYTLGVSAAKFQIDKGRDAWKNYVLKLNSQLLAPNIRAHCGSCHEKDGRDLRYFNFSPLSIIKRTEFHQVPHTTAVQVACYIMSLTGPNPGYPWSPVYQPGVGLDSVPVSSWSAGAGIVAVLNNDNDVQPYLFSGDHTITAANMATTGHLNPRETPSSIQFPSWISWLPRIHPLDAFGTTFSNSAFWNDYATIESHLIANTASVYTANTNGGSYQNRSLAGRDETKWDADKVALLAIVKAAAGASTTWNKTFTESIYSLGQWQLTKTWEFKQKYKNEEYGIHTYGSAHGEKRMWYGQAHFYVAPGIVGIPFNATQIPRGQPGNENKWWITLNTAWYEVQFALNTGGGFRVTTSPLDYPYYVNSAAAYERIVSLQTAYLIMKYIVFRNQVNHNTYGLNPSYGWDPRLQESIYPQYDPGNFDVWFAKLPLTTKSQLFNAFTQVWLSENQLYTPSQFYASGETTAGEDWLTYGTLANVARQIIYRASTVGLNNTNRDSMITWAKTIWPSRNWDSLVTNPTYYVAINGNDVNPGTSTLPFKTITKGASVLHPGDSLYVHSGTYNESFNRTIPSGTSWTTPVTISAVPGDTPPIIKPTAHVASVFYYDNSTQYVIVSGFVIDGSNITNDGIKITNGGSGSAHHNRFQNCEILNSPQQNILITHSNYNEFINCISHDACTVHQGTLGRSLCHTLYVESDHNKWQGGKLYNSASYGGQFYASNGIDCHDNLIDGAEIYNNALNGTTSGGGIVIGSGSNNIVQNCNIHNNPNNNILMDYGAVTNTVQFCNIHDGTGIGFTIGTGSTGAVFNNNTFSNNAGGDFINLGH